MKPPSPARDTVLAAGLAAVLAACASGGGAPAGAPEPAVGSRTARELAIRGALSLPAGGLAARADGGVVAGMIAWGSVSADRTSWAAEGESWVLLLSLSAEMEIAGAQVVSAGTSGRVELTGLAPVPGGVRLEGTFAGSLAVDGETLVVGDFRTRPFSLVLDEVGRIATEPSVGDHAPEETPDGVPFVVPPDLDGEVRIFSAWIDEERGAFTVGAAGHRGFAARAGPPGTPTWWIPADGARIQWLETLVLDGGVLTVAGAGGHDGRIGSMHVAAGQAEPLDGLSPIVAALDVRDGAPRWAWTDDDPAPRMARALAVDPQRGAVWVGAEESGVGGSGPRGELPWIGDPGVVIFRLSE